MSKPYDLVVVGAGSGGLTAAAFAARLGARVALIEKHRIGGDCTWTGCVPSKALLKAARIAHEIRRAPGFGIEVGPVKVNLGRVRASIEAAIAEVYRHEAPPELEKLGIEVVLAPAAFVDPHTLRAGERTLRARRILLCTGARPAAPAIPGLTDVPHLTYERIFANQRLPEHFVVLGAGPIGMEMAQAYRRLGAAVTVVGPTVLPKEEPEAQALVEQVLAGEGIRFVKARVTGARPAGAGFVLSHAEGEVTGDLLLVSAGRRPNVEGLDLERAGIRYSERGIHVDQRLRTSARHVYAAGDVVGGYQFTHFAGWQAFQAVRNALLPGSASGFSEVVPWVTFLDPEIAHVGLTEAQARDKHGDRIRVQRLDLARADRAICDQETAGFIKTVTDQRGRLLGATIVASRAGEMIAELALAIRHKLTLTDVAGTIHAYPTWSTPVQQLASDDAVDRFLHGPSGRIALCLARLGR